MKVINKKIAISIVLASMLVSNLYGTQRSLAEGVTNSNFTSVANLGGDIDMTLLDGLDVAPLGEQGDLIDSYGLDDASDNPEFNPNAMEEVQEETENLDTGLTPPPVNVLPEIEEEQELGLTIEQAQQIQNVETVTIFDLNLSNIEPVTVLDLNLSNIEPVTVLDLNLSNIEPVTVLDPEPLNLESNQILKVTAPILSVESINSNKITLNWNDTSDTETAYKIYSSTSSESGYELNSTESSGVITKDIVDLNENTTYYFKVGVVNAGGENNSSEESNTTNAKPTFTAFTAQNQNENFGATTLTITDLLDENSENISLSVESNDSSIFSTSTSWDGDLTNAQYNGQTLTITLNSEANVNGVVELNITAYDGFDSVNNIFNVTVIAVNDTPIINTNNTLTVVEKKGRNISNSYLNSSDIDNNTTLFYTLVTPATNGNLYFESNTTAIVANERFTQALINSGDINYTHNGTETTSDSFVFNVSDQSGVTTSNAIFNITITEFNDSPTYDIDTTDINVNEDFSDFNISLINIIDPENRDLNITVESNDSSIISFAQNWSTNVTSSSYTQDLNISFSSISNKYGTAELNIIVDDGVNEVTKGFNVTINPTDDNPTITTVPNISKDMNFSEFNLGINITDIDLGDINLTVDVNDTSLIEFNPTWYNDINGYNLTSSEYNNQDINLTIKPKPNVEGIVRFTLTLEDNQSGEITSSFDLNISAYNLVLADLNAIDIPSFLEFHYKKYPAIGSINGSAIEWSNPKTRANRVLRKSLSDITASFDNPTKYVQVTATARLANTTLKKDFNTSMYQNHPLYSVNSLYSGSFNFDFESTSYTESSTNSGQNLADTLFKSVDETVGGLSDISSVITKENSTSSITGAFLNDPAFQAVVASEVVAVGGNVKADVTTQLDKTVINTEEVIRGRVSSQVQMEISEKSTSIEMKQRPTSDGIGTTQSSMTTFKTLGSMGKNKAQVTLRDDGGFTSEIKNNSLKSSVTVSSDNIDLSISNQSLNGEKTIDVSVKMPLGATITQDNEGNINSKTTLTNKDKEKIIEQLENSSIDFIVKEVDLTVDIKADGSSNALAKILTNDKKTKTYSLSSRKNTSNVRIYVLNSNQANSFFLIKALFETKPKTTLRAKNNERVVIENDSIKITSISDLQEFEENQYIDKRTIKLISGRANILKDGIEEEMIIGFEYEFIPTSEAKALNAIYDEDTHYLYLKKGWSLISSPINQELNITETFYTSEMSYKFHNNSWIENPKILKPNEGMWIQYNFDIYVHFTDNDLSKSYEFNSSILNSGWNLVGTGIDVNLNSSEYKAVWTYDNITKEYVNNPTQILRGYGFWIKK